MEKCLDFRMRTCLKTRQINEEWHIQWGGVWEPKRLEMGIIWGDCERHYHPEHGETRWKRKTSSRSMQHTGRSPVRPVCLATGSTAQQVLPADFSSKSQGTQRGFEKEQQIHTLMCSSQCVDSKLDNQWVSSMLGYTISLSFRNDSRITWILWISRKTSSAFW